MRVAHLWYSLPLFGGAETWAIGLSKALRKLGTESDILCWKTEGSPEHQSFFKVLDRRVPSSPDIIDALMNGAFMTKDLKEYDLLCVHHTNVLFPAVFCKNLFGSQVVSILHSPPIRWALSEEGLVSYRHVSEKSQQMYTLWKMFMPYTDFFTNTKWNQKLYEKYEAISPLPLLAGVDHEIFKPSDVLREKYRKKLKIDDETILLFYASAAGRRKKHELLLRGMQTLIRKGHKVKCVLTCSKDRLSHEFHPLVGRIVEELGLTEHVFAFPATSDESLHGFYNACDIYVHPADNEHLGMAIMEAMATGKPIIAQNNGGVPEIVEDGVEGFLFKTNSVNHMVKCVEKLIADKKLRETMGKKAFEHSLGFSWADVAREFLEVVS
ncbi:MAG: glycosyltransferase family 4 protein [Candidatus Bathyarchaeota archaeon]